LAGQEEEMTGPKRLVLDANILLRAVFGSRVRILLETYEDSASFYTPEICFQDARKYIAVLSQTRKLDPAAGLLVLDHLSHLVETVDTGLYEAHESLLANECVPAMSTTGPSRQLLCFSIAPSGQKIRTSSAVASQPGRRVMSSYICETPDIGLFTERQTGLQ
jgi:hypothetical protein